MPIWIEVLFLGSKYHRRLLLQGHLMFLFRRELDRRVTQMKKYRYSRYRLYYRTVVFGWLPVMSREEFHSGCHVVVGSGLTIRNHIPLLFPLLFYLILNGGGYFKVLYLDEWCHCHAWTQSHRKLASPFSLLFVRWICLIFGEMCIRYHRNRVREWGRDFNHHWKKYRVGRCWDDLGSFGFWFSELIGWWNVILHGIFSWESFLGRRWSLCGGGWMIKYIHSEVYGSELSLLQIL